MLSVVGTAWEQVEANLLLTCTRALIPHRNLAERIADHSGMQIEQRA